MEHHMGHAMEHDLDAGIIGCIQIVCGVRMWGRHSSDRALGHTILKAYKKENRIALPISFGGTVSVSNQAKKNREGFNSLP